MADDLVFIRNFSTFPSVMKATAILYLLLEIAQGLLLHPYQTMQSLVRDKVFVWLALLPTVVLALVTVFWKCVFVLVVQLLISCQAAPAICELLPFVSTWITFFCLYWQILLLYLMFRFSAAFKNAV